MSIYTRNKLSEYCIFQKNLIIINPDKISNDKITFSMDS